MIIDWCFCVTCRGYESGAGGGGCSGLFCWNNTKSNKRIKVMMVLPI